MRTVALIAGVVVALAGCAGSPEPVPLPAVTEAPAVPAALARFYAQQLTWTGCGDRGRECAQVEVPLDYGEPGGAVIQVAIQRIPARKPGQRVGALLVNPGGPGRSGIAALDGLASIAGGGVRDAFDLVGFDPRGVGASSGVDCFDDPQLEAWIDPGYDPTGAAGIARRVQQARAMAASCRAKAGALLDHVDTAAAARDLDILRAALGDDRVTFLGVSYGTALGATYAALFPQRVGRMVLDAGIDPNLDDPEFTMGLAGGLESALASFVRYCLATRPCPLQGTQQDGVGKVRALLDGLVDDPLPAGDRRPLSAPLAVRALMLGVADDQAWSELALALGWALDRHDGGPLLRMADALDGRDAAGHYPNSTLAAGTAITCADTPAPLGPDGLAAHADALAGASPTFGRYLLDSAMLCSVWPTEPPPRPGADPSAAGAEPILVVGTTHDPIAPYAWSQALAEKLQSARLLSYDGFGHTTYGHSNTCVTAAVETYLLTGALPTVGTTC